MNENFGEVNKQLDTKKDPKYDLLKTLVADYLKNDFSAITKENRIANMLEEITKIEGDNIVEGNSESGDSKLDIIDVYKQVVHAPVTDTRKKTLRNELSNLQTACQDKDTDGCVEFALQECNKSEKKDDKDGCLRNFTVTEGGKRRKQKRRTKKKSRKAKKAKKAKKKTKRSRK
jgi:hypothetical protein